MISGLLKKSFVEGRQTTPFQPHSHPSPPHMYSHAHRRYKMEAILLEL